jgi:hypothetical protein
MADTLNSQVPLELQPELQGINRQQELAKMLLQQGTQQPQGQMVSGRYVAPALTQYLQPLFGAYAGQKGLENVENQQLALAKAIREGQQGEQAAIMERLNAGDTKGALGLASGSKFGGGKEFIPALIGNVIPKTPEKVAEYNFAKEQGFKGSYNDFANQMNEYQTRSLALQAANQNKPQIVETPNGYVAVNPNNPSQATPVMLNGQPIMGSKSNLPEGATGQVTGVQNVKSALNDLKTNLKDFKTFDMANPNKRALMSTDYENVILQLKEAMKLGVLNGNDYTILTSMITNPNAPGALLINKETQMKQIDNLEKKLNDMTSNVYKTHQRNVPSNLQQPEISNAITTNKQVPVLKYNLQTGNWE